MILRKRPITIAFAIAGIVAGAHAGIAAVSTDTANSVALQTELPAATEVQTPVEMQTDVQAPATVGAPVAQSSAENIVQPKWQVAPLQEAQKVAVRDQTDEYYARIPFTNKTIKVTNPTFPRNSSEYPDPMPSVVAYFDAKNANTVLVGAPSPVFPGGSEESPQNPAVIAYFDRLDAQRVAAAAKLQQTQQATAGIDTQAASSTAPAQSPGT